MDSSLNTNDSDSVTPNKAYAEMQSEFVKKIRQRMKRHKVTGLSLGLVDDGDLVWAQGFGFADKKNKRLADKNTMYKLGSITKLLTASAIMQLVEANKLELDTPIQRIIPELKIQYHAETNRPITIRSIMTHSSGLPSDVMSGMFNRKPESFHKSIDYLNSMHAAYEPGTISTYSNIAMDLLGIAIERVSGLSYADYIQKNILHPLGMLQSSVDVERIDNSQMSLAYNRFKEKEEYPLRSQPAGSLYSNVLEASYFISMALRKGSPILTENSFEQMTHDQTEHTRYKSGNRFGLNWVVVRPGVEYLGPVCWHSGGTVNFMSTLVALPECGLGVVVLSNSAKSMSFIEETANDILKSAAKIKLGLNDPGNGLKQQVKAPPIPEQTIQETVGHYATLGGAVKITQKGKKLVAKMVAKPLTFKLHYQEDGWFSLKARLFGFIPLPIKKLKSIRVKTERLNGIKLIKGKDGVTPFLIGEAYKPEKLGACWKPYLGNYKVQYPEGDYEWFNKVSLIEKSGFLILAVNINQTGTMYMPLITLSEPNSSGQLMAITAGLGRGMRETLYAQSHELPELFYSAYRLIKQ